MAVSSKRRTASFLRRRYLAIPAASSKIVRRSSGRLFRISSILFCPMMDMEPLPRPVSAIKSTISFKRQLFLLMEYSLSPLRNKRLVRLTSSKSISKAWSLLSKFKVTSATPKALRLLLPEKMTSSILLPRRYFALCSPKTQRMASEILLLPEPLGPTTAVMPLSNVNSVLSAKDLKP